MVALLARLALLTLLLCILLYVHDRALLLHVLMPMQPTPHLHVHVVAYLACLLACSALQAHLFAPLAVVTMLALLAVLCGLQHPICMCKGACACSCICLLRLLCLLWLFSLHCLCFVACSCTCMVLRCSCTCSCPCNAQFARACRLVEIIRLLRIFACCTCYDDRTCLTCIACFALLRALLGGSVCLLCVRLFAARAYSHARAHAHVQTYPHEHPY